jgi:MarR family transcriptional regulator, lower aerobic nicotinate degradation pathway regulator
MGAHTNDGDIRLILDSIRRIVRALRLFDRDAEKHAGLSGAQLFVLQNLGREKLSVNDLADRTHTHQSSVSVVVDKLVQRGLVARARSKDDSRRAVLSMTPAGRDVLRSAPPAAQQRLITALAGLSRPRRKMLARLLVELTENTGIDVHPPVLFFEDAKARRKR